jgi:hypothetical protein
MIIFRIRPWRLQRVMRSQVGFHRGEGKFIYEVTLSNGANVVSASDPWLFIAWLKAHMKKLNLPK